MAGSKTDTFENQLLLLLFNNTTIANIGDGTGIEGSTVPGSFYVRLYTSAVAVDDSTLGTEAAYTGYVQYGVAVARSGAGFTVAASNASNAAAITFGASTSSETIRYFGIWKTNVDETLANRIMWAQLDSDLAVSTGITPEFAIGDLDVNED